MDNSPRYVLLFSHLHVGAHDFSPMCSRTDASVGEGKVSAREREAHISRRQYAGWLKILKRSLAPANWTVFGCNKVTISVPRKRTTLFAARTLIESRASISSFPFSEGKESSIGLCCTLSRGNDLLRYNENLQITHLLRD